MAVNPVTWASNHLTLVVTGVLALLVLAWAYESYDAADDGREAAQMFGGRVKRQTGGWLNVALVSLVAVVGGIAQATGQFGEVIAYGAGFIPQMPVLSAALFTIGLGGIGLSGQLALTWWQFIGIAGITVFLAVAWRADLS